MLLNNFFFFQINIERGRTLLLRYDKSGCRYLSFSFKKQMIKTTTDAAAQFLISFLLFFCILRDISFECLFFIEGVCGIKGDAAVELTLQQI